MITTLINLVLENIKSLINCFETTKIHQSETEIIKDKKNLKQAANIAEEIYQLIRDYIALDNQFISFLGKEVFDYMDKDEKRIYKRFVVSKLKIKKKMDNLQKKFERVD